MTFLHNLWYNMKTYQASQKARREDSTIQAGELLIGIISRMSYEDIRKVRKLIELWGPDNG